MNVGGQNKTTELRRKGYDMVAVESKILARQNARTDVPAGVNLSEGNLSRIFAAIKNDDVDFYENFLFDLYTGNASIDSLRVDSLISADTSTTLPEVARDYFRNPHDPLTHRILEESLFTTDGMRSVPFSKKDELRKGDRVLIGGDIYRVTRVGDNTFVYVDRLLHSDEGSPVIYKKPTHYTQITHKFVPAVGGGATSTGVSGGAGGAAGGAMRSNKRSRRNNSKNNRRNNRRNISRRRRF